MESQIQWDNILVKSNIYPNKGKYRVWNSSFIQIKSRLYSAFVWNVCLEIVGKNLGKICIKPNWNPEFIGIFARHLSIAMNHRSFFLKKKNPNGIWHFPCSNAFCSLISPILLLLWKGTRLFLPLAHSSEEERSLVRSPYVPLCCCRSVNKPADAWMDECITSQHPYSTSPCSHRATSS